MNPENLYPCPCCGYLVFDEPPGSDCLCPICFWHDDVSQLRFPMEGGGPNKLSLLEAQRTFQRLGAKEPRVQDRRDEGWRPIDPQRDDVEYSVKGTNYGSTYPDDPTVLYYWRPNFWRLKR